MHFLTITTTKKQKCIFKLLTKSCKTRLTLPKNEQTYSHVDKYPGITEELDQVVHKEETFFQAKKSCKHSNIKRVMNSWLLFGKPMLPNAFTFYLKKFNIYSRSLRTLDSMLILFIFSSCVHKTV